MLQPHDSLTTVPSLSLTLPELRTHVERHVSAVTRQGIAGKTDLLVTLLTESYLGLRPHDDVVEFLPGVDIPTQFLFASSFSASRLKNGLGGSTGDYKKYLRPFWHFEEGNRGYDVKSGRTKSYLLKDETLGVLDDAWRNNVPALVRDRETGRLVSAADLPANGVAKTARSMIRTPALLTFDRARLDRTIAELESSLRGCYGLPQRHRDVLSLRWLYVARKWVLALGGIPNLYRDYDTDPGMSSGRLIGVGELHLQRLMRPARTRLYAGTGWHDYDFRACHYSILLSLARGYGLSTPNLEAYMEDKAATDARIAEETGLRDGHMKPIMNAVLYDQPVAASPYNELFDLIGKDGIRRLQENTTFTALRAEVKRLADLLIRRHRAGANVLNALGRTYPRTYMCRTKAKIRSTPRRVLMSHILQGYEAWCLNLVCEGRSDIAVLMHDGWVSKSWGDVQAVEDQIRAESQECFGFGIQLKIKCTGFD